MEILGWPSVLSRNVEDPIIPYKDIWLPSESPSLGHTSIRRGLKGFFGQLCLFPPQIILPSIKLNFLLPRQEWTQLFEKTVQFSSVSQSCPTLCDPMNCSTPGLPVHHQLPEFPQTHVHRVSEAIHPSHPLSSPSPPAPNPSQHQSLFQ